MKIEIKTVGDVAVVSLGEKLDIYNSPGIRGAVAELHSGGRTNVVFSLEDVPYIDSSGLGALISAHVFMKKNGGVLKLTGLNGFVRHTFEITRTNELFEIYDTVEDAVKSFKNV